MTSLTDTSSAKSGIEVTPHDTNVFEPCRAIYVGVSGDVNVRWVSGETSLMKSAAVGVHPWCLTGVLDADTTATDIVALY